MKKRFTEEQILRILQEAEAGMSTRDVCRKHGIAEQTFYRWKTKYGGMDVSDAKRLKALEHENNELKIGPRGVRHCPIYIKPTDAHRDRRRTIESGRSPRHGFLQTTGKANVGSKARRQSDRATPRGRCSKQSASIHRVGRSVLRWAGSLLAVSAISSPPNGPHPGCTNR